MNRHRLFWGTMVILLGVMLLLNTFGILKVNAWSIFWPILLVIIGIWFLVGPIFFNKKIESQHLSVPLGNASALEVKVKHGAGRLNISPSPFGSPDALAGDFVGGVDQTSEMNGQKMTVNLKTPGDLFWGFTPFSGFEGFTWDMTINRDTPVSLVIQSGADEAHLNLREMKVTDLKIETGASSTRVILPASAGLTHGSIQTGAASLHLQVPEGVAGRFSIKHGMAGINVNSSRFIKNGDAYETPGFLSSPNRVDLVIETGVGSVDIF